MFSKPVQNLLILMLLAWLTGTPARANEHLNALTRAEVRAFTGSESISSPYAFDVEVDAPSPNINFNQVVDQPLTLTVAPGRQISGVVRQIEQLDAAPRSGRYRITLAPPLARLDHRMTSRTFQETSVPEAVSSMLEQVGSAYVMRLDSTYPTEPLMMQFQESEFDFLSRRLERLGIHYHFETTAGGEALILGDRAAAFPALPDPRLQFAPRGTGTVTTFNRGLSLHAGVVRTGNYAWQTPAANLTATTQSGLFPGLVEAAFPAPVATSEASQRYADVRAAARTAAAQTCQGTSSHPQMRPGHLFALTNHPRRDNNQEYLIVSVDHDGTSGRYQNRFTCLPVSVPFKPLPVTPEPRISGVVPAIVVAPAGESRHVDQFGRVQVHFPWSDPSFSANHEPGDARWVRVAQLAAGSRTAALWLPETGDEVAVAFEHGDPDRPVVVGSLYNGQRLPPVALPAEKHRTVMRSGTAIPVEVVLDNQPGSEALILRAGAQHVVLDADAIRISSPILPPGPATPQPRPRELPAPTRRQ